MKPAFHSWTQFLAMGGYGFYVWLSVAVALSALGLIIAHTLLQRKRLLKQIHQRQARDQRIAAARERKAALKNQGENQ